ncbi:MAG: hypothetical protein HFE86_05485 [Clostridiales bacterium]|nr:hypothetical protein [Clostridiales bacterium]
MSLLLAGGFFLLALIGLPALIREKRWRELGVFAVLWLLAAALAFLLAAGVYPPSPLESFRGLAQHLLS